MTRRRDLAGGLVVGEAEEAGQVAAPRRQRGVDRRLEPGVVPAAVEPLYLTGVP